MMMNNESLRYKYSRRKILHNPHPGEQVAHSLHPPNVVLDLLGSPTPTPPPMTTVMSLSLTVFITFCGGYLSPKTWFRPRWACCSSRSSFKRCFWLSRLPHAPIPTPITAGMSLSLSLTVFITFSGSQQTQNMIPTQISRWLVPFILRTSFSILSATTPLWATPPWLPPRRVVLPLCVLAASWLRFCFRRILNCPRICTGRIKKIEILFFSLNNGPRQVCAPTKSSHLSNTCPYVQDAGTPRADRCRVNGSKQQFHTINFRK